MTKRDATSKESSDTRRRRFVLFGIFALLVVGLGAYYSVSQRWVKATRFEAVTLSIETSLPMSIIWIAEAKGYFREEGLALTIKKFESGRSGFLALLQGDQGVDIAAVSPPAIALESFKQNNSVIFASFFSSDSAIKIIARRDRGILNSKDLKGHKLGLTKGSASHFFAESFLISNGLSIADVQVINFNPSDLPGALSTGQVDAISAWQPQAYYAQKLLGDAAVTLPSDGIYKGSMNLVTKKDFAEHHREILIKILRAVEKAIAFTKTHQAEAKEIAASKLNQNKEELALLWGEAQFELSLDQSLVLSLEDVARWAIRARLTDQSKIPNFLTYIDAAALQAVKPSAVTIIGK